MECRDPTGVTACPITLRHSKTCLLPRARGGPSTSIPRFADEIGVSTRTVWRLIAAGKIKTIPLSIAGEPASQPANWKRSPRVVLRMERARPAYPRPAAADAKAGLNKVDRITKGDRAFFERFPHRQYRVRLAGQPEIEQYPGIVDEKACRRRTHTRSTSPCATSNPGARLRQFLAWRLKGLETDLSETTARGIFETAATPWIREVEADMRRMAGAPASVHPPLRPRVAPEPRSSARSAEYEGQCIPVVRLFSRINIGNRLREISLALRGASYRIELEIKRRLDANGCEAESRRP